MGADRFQRIGLVDTYLRLGVLERGLRFQLGVRERHRVPETGALTPWVQEFLLTEERGLCGTLSPHLGHLRMLESLAMWGNQGLAGPLPPSLGSLRRLELLHLNHCALSGPLPAKALSAGGAGMLAQIQLQSNQLSGRLPTELGTLRFLQHLDLGCNRFHGPVPATLGMLTRLTYLVGLRE
jgi:hypothetical protein